MNIGLTDGADPTASLYDDPSAAMLVAPEAEHLVQALAPLPVGEIPSDKWLTQHGWIERLNMQAHVNASQMCDEFVMEALVLHEKMPTLVHSLLASELWRTNVFPKLRERAAELDGVRLYQALYHEGIVANLLEVSMFHRQACEACGDSLLDLLDWAHRRLVWLEAHQPPPEFGHKKPEDVKKVLLGGGVAGQLDRQLDTIEMGASLAACSIVRFALEHGESLPAGVLARLLDSYDIVMLVARLLETRPWRCRRGTDGSEMRFDSGHWVAVGDAARHRLPKVEAQLWLTLLSLATDPAVRARYAFTDFRKAALVRLRKYLNETVVDQIPPLSQLQRAIDELSLTDTPAQQHKPAYVLEQLPALREALARGQDWAAVAASSIDRYFSSSHEAKQRHAEELAKLYSSPAVERLLTGPSSQGGNTSSNNSGGWTDGAPPGEFTLLIEIRPDGDEADVTDIVTVSAKGREPTFQTVLEVEPNSASLQLPGTGGSVLVRARLLASDGSEVASTADGVHGWSAPLHLPQKGGKSKAWLQLGHDPTKLRVQLLITRANSSNKTGGYGGASGWVVGSARATAPERHALRLEFVPETAGAEHTAVVVAEGCAIPGVAQSLFRPTGGTGDVLLPLSCRVRAELRAGDKVWRAVETRLELSKERALQWAQVGKGEQALRIQLRLRQAVHGGVKGIELAAVYVTLPDEAQGVNSESANSEGAVANGNSNGNGNGTAAAIAAGAAVEAKPRAKIEVLN